MELEGTVVQVAVEVGHGMSLSLVLRIHDPVVSTRIHEAKVVGLLYRFLPCVEATPWTPVDLTSMGRQLNHLFLDHIPRLARLVDHLAHYCASNSRKATSPVR